MMNPIKNFNKKKPLFKVSYSINGQYNSHIFEADNLKMANDIWRNSIPYTRGIVRFIAIGGPLA